MIEIKNINKKYSKSLVLNNISFKIKKGDCIGIVGKNGAGKSTLLSILAGTNKEDSGEFIINNKNVFKNKKMFRTLIGYVPQENPLISELTVLDNLKLWYCDSILGLKKELDDGILSFLDLAPMLNKKVKNLSGGMKKRVSIGIALAGHPPILILDEPGTALDPACKHDIIKYLAHYLDIGGTILISTHDEMEIKMCNRLFLMKDSLLTEISPSTDMDNLIKLIQ